MASKKNNHKQENINLNDDSVEILTPTSINANNQASLELSDDNKTVSIDKDGIAVNKNGNLVVGNINLAINPLKKRWNRNYRQNGWNLVTDIFLLLGLISLILFTILNNKEFLSKKVSLDINIPEEIISGSINSIELNYKTRAVAESSSIQAILPNNFVIESVSPSNLFNKETNTFNLGTLDKNYSGKIKINGLIWGEVSDQHLVSFIFNCKECGDDGVSDSLSYNIRQVALENSLEIENSAYLNSEINGVLHLKNNTDNSISDIKINLGSDIAIRNSDLKIEGDKLLLKEIKNGEELDIKFTAWCEKNNNTISITPKFSFNLLNTDISFSGEKKSLEIKNVDFAVNILNNKKNVNENENITYTLNYNNKEDRTINNVRMTVSSANPNFFLEPIKILNSPKNITYNGNEIILGDLSGKDSGSIELNASFDRRQIASNQELFLKINLQYEVDGKTIKHTVYSNKNKIVSKTSTSALAYYYSPTGDQLGVGSLPPAVDMATNYWIFLEFNNLGNDLKNFSLTAELPNNVYFSDNKRVLDGNLIYGEIGKRLIWEVPEIGGANKKYRASFEVTLIPEANDYGKIVELLKNIKYTAYDNFTEQDLSQNIQNIDTNLKNDKLSSGRGVVTSIK